MNNLLRTLLLAPVVCLAPPGHGQEPAEEGVTVLPPVVIVKPQGAFDESDGMKRLREGLDMPRGPVLQQRTPLVVNVAEFIVWGLTAPPPEGRAAPEDEAYFFAMQGVREVVTGCSAVKC